MSDFFALDIRFNSKNHEASILSNLYPRNFMFDEVRCRSIEGVLQAFKTPTLALQAQYAGFSGVKAKDLSLQLAHWQYGQVLHWNGKTFHRSSPEYQRLVASLYDAVFLQCEKYRAALARTKFLALSHSIGVNDTSKTVLTTAEFLCQLYRLRSYVLNPHTDFQYI